MNNRTYINIKLKKTSRYLFNNLPVSLSSLIDQISYHPTVLTRDDNSSFPENDRHLHLKCVIKRLNIFVVSVYIAASLKANAAETTGVIGQLLQVIFLLSEELLQPRVN